MIANSFILLNILCFLSGLVVVSGVTGVTRILSLIMLYVFMSLCLIILNYIYLGLTYLIVYSGAIAIIFLFIIMLIPQRPKANSGYRLLTLIIIAIQCIYLIYIDHDKNIYLLHIKDISFLSFSHSDIFLLGTAIYYRHIAVVYLIGLYLLSILLGVIAIVRS